MPDSTSTRLRQVQLAGAVLAVAILTACGTSTAPPAAGPTRDARERAYRANNTGVALLEQLKYPEAAAAFREALSIDETLAMARLNLSLALLYEQDLDGAASAATEAAARMPDAPQPSYVLALIARAQSRNEAALALLEKVRAIDTADVGTNVNLAQIELEEKRYNDAIAALEPVVSREPYHVTAAYVLGLALSRGGRAEDGQRLLERARSLRTASYAVTFGTGYLEQGRYAEAMASTGAEPELVNPQTPPAAFTPTRIGGTTDGATQASTPLPFGRRVPAGELSDAGARALAASLGGAQTLVDVDGDGTLDLVVVSAAGQRLYRRDARGAWTDATAGSGLESMPTNAVPVGVVSADVDNDGFPDLYVLRYQGSSLYRNDGKGHFTDVTRAARLPAYSALPGAAAFVDVDHDGDVDLLIAGLADVAATRRLRAAAYDFPAGFAPAPLQLLRNNGNGTFTDITTAARLDARGHAIAVVPTDFDNHRDIDLLVVNSDTAPRLFSNQRDGTFRDVATEVGLAGVVKAGERVGAVAVGDVNKDDWPDFFFARGGDAMLALSDGRGRFNLSSAPDALRTATAAQFVDYDNDGLLDLVALTSTGVVVVRDLGHTWLDVTATAVAATTASAGVDARSFAAADLDHDGNTDIVTTRGDTAWSWRNSGDPHNHALRVQLRGRVTNRAGVGSKVQVRAGSLGSRVETSAAFPAVAPTDIVFGLGSRAGAEVTRVLWPSGILQAEAAAGDGAGAPLLPSPFLVEELDRKPSSCPFLFAWNGERFEFITDFLGGGEMGYWEGPGHYNQPNPVEYVRMRGDQLVPSDGHLQLRVTNELEEVLYLDRMQLIDVVHPSDVQVFPNEGMTTPPKPYRLLAVRQPQPPVAVVDEHGHDMRERVARLDRTYPDDFGLERIRGYARPHALTIDIGASRTQTLLLTGWTDYAFSSDNVAAHQAGLSAIEPYLEVRDRAGRWRRLAIAIGIPVGRPQTIPLELGALLRPGEHELRLTTSMRIYWDQIQVGETVSGNMTVSTPADPRSAILRERGFSAEVRPDGDDPPGYDYQRVSTDSPWKAFAGRYTKTGDVRSLLSAADDQFVVAKPGDEVALEFDAPRNAVPPGWTRTWLLRGDGFSKEMDVNSASPDTVEPMPFHAMSGYPYPAHEQYPESAAHSLYRERFNTRAVPRPVPMLERPGRGRVSTWK